MENMCRTLGLSPHMWQRKLMKIHFVLVFLKFSPHSKLTKTNKNLGNEILAAIFRFITLLKFEHNRESLFVDFD